MTEQGETVTARYGEPRDRAARPRAGRSARCCSRAWPSATPVPRAELAARDAVFDDAAEAALRAYQRAARRPRSARALRARRHADRGGRPRCRSARARLAHGRASRSRTCARSRGCSRGTRAGTACPAGSASARRSRRWSRELGHRARARAVPRVAVLPRAGRQRAARARARRHRRRRVLRAAGRPRRAAALPADPRRVGAHRRSACSRSRTSARSSATARTSSPPCARRNPYVDVLSHAQIELLRRLARADGRRRARAAPRRAVHDHQRHRRRPADRRLSVSGKLSACPRRPTSRTSRSST